MEVEQSRSTRTNRTLVLDSQTMTIPSARRGLLCALHLEFVGFVANDRKWKTTRNDLKVEEHRLMV